MRNNKRYLFNVRLDPELERKLDELAKATDRNRSAYIRHLIRREWDAQNIAQQPPQQTTPQQ